MFKNLFSSVSAHYQKHKKMINASAIIFFVAVVLVTGPLMANAYLTMKAEQALKISMKNDAIEGAILKNDYKQWSELVNDDSLKSQVNETNFAKFSEAYRLLQKGRLDEADIIKKSLGLKKDFTTATQKSKAINFAIKSNDYAAWRGIVGENVEPSVNADNFKKYTLMYTLILKGQIDQAERVRYSIETGKSSASDIRNVDKATSPKAAEKRAPAKAPVKTKQVPAKE